MKITIQDVLDQLLAVQYYRFPETTTTVCCITLQNGFTVVGQSACADPKEFNEELGKDLAYKDALNKIWVLEGYVLKNKLRAEAGASL